MKKKKARGMCCVSYNGEVTAVGCNWVRKESSEWEALKHTFAFDAFLMLLVSCGVEGYRGGTCNSNGIGIVE